MAFSTGQAITGIALELFPAFTTLVTTMRSSYWIQSHINRPARPQAPPTHPPAPHGSTAPPPACTNNPRSRPRPLSGADTHGPPCHPLSPVHPQGRAHAPNRLLRPTTTQLAAPSTHPEAHLHSTMRGTLRQSYQSCITGFLPAARQFSAREA